MAPDVASEHINGTTNGTANGASNGSRGKKKDLSEEAYRIVQEKVPHMQSMNAVLELDISLPQGVIFIDFRSEPCQILNQFDSESNCSVNIKPLYVKRFYEGAMDPRYGLFKDGEWRAC